MQLIGTLFAGLIVGAIVFSFSSFITGIAAVFQLLPRLEPVVRKLSWGMLIASCRLYYLLLSRLAEPIEARWGIDILSGLKRIGCTVSLSILIGIGLTLLFGWSISVWSLFFSALHGLFVDFLWEEIGDADLLYMGTRVND